MAKIYTQDQVDLVKMSVKVDNIEKTVTSMNTKMEQDYVTQEEFKPIRNFINIIQGLVITGVVGALLALIIKK